MFISTLLVARVTVHGLDLTDLVCVVLHMEAVHRQPSAAVEFAKASVSATVSRRSRPSISLTAASRAAWLSLIAWTSTGRRLTTTFRIENPGLCSPLEPPATGPSCVQSVSVRSLNRSRTVLRQVASFRSLSEETGWSRMEQTIALLNAITVSWSSS